MIVENDYLPQLPKGWVWTTLGEIITLEYGKGLVKSKRDPQGAFPVYGSSGMVGRHSIPLVEKPCLIVGRKGAIGSVHLSKEPCWAIDTTYYVIPPEGLDLSFLFYLLYNIRLYSFDRSTAIPGLNRDDAYAIKIPLAPFPEQGRIVAKVEELFTNLDASVESLKKVKSQLKRYRQAVLKYAFEGKLTEEWRKTHKDQIVPAQKLLEQIKQERKNLEGNKYKELPPIDTTDMPELPENWAWTRLGEALFQSKERFDPKSSQDERFIGLEHIEGNTGRLLGYGKSSETRSTKNKFKKGELLYGKLRPYLNKVYIAEFDGVCSTDILVFQKNELVENKFIAKLMLSNDFVKCMTQHMSGVQHPRVNYQTISNYVIPFPPLLEQQEIAVRIEQHFSIADEVEKLTEQTTRQAQQLHQSILKKAFEGRLVPQDPTDEPAEKLLEHIKEERLRHVVKEAASKEKLKNETWKQIGLMRYVE